MKREDELLMELAMYRDMESVVSVSLKNGKTFICYVKNFDHQEDDSKVVLSKVNETTMFPSESQTVTIYINNISEVDLAE